MIVVFLRNNDIKPVKIRQITFHLQIMHINSGPGIQNLFGFLIGNPT